ncbi:NHS-like protein 2 isoform X2 [Megalops cyprinoides]|uniref:NHS-like protein 2 isoform X2 n=1 Tax=Megalops cyprinoides TaxID=118141 RepID=UPI001864193B|nr:NHS-like protein 2 isoform X2 [Megalops cyprinoides]
MPFCKRTIAPKDVCKGDTKRQGAIFGDLVDVCGFTLCSVLRQLSDLSRQSVSILEELEGELVSICHRSGTLENKVISLQKHLSALATKPPPKTTTNLDSENKRTAHFRSSWQQHVNVFGSWSRPECVQELHQEAQLNLQSLLQDFEEQLYDHKVTGQTFRQPSSQSSEDTSQSRSPVTANNKRPEFVFLPASKQVCEDETTSVGIRAQDPTGCGSGRPLLGWSSSVGPPVAEKPRWYLGRHTPAHLIPIDVTGDGKIQGVDLIEGACSPEASHSQLVTPSSDTPSHHLPLRKAYSNLDQSLPQSPESPSGMMEHATLMCASPSWNGPKGSTFSPSWNNSYANYVLAPSPVAKAPASQHEAAGAACPSSGLSMSSGSHSNSLTSISMEPLARAHGATPAGRRSETEGAASPGEREKRSTRAGVFKFRERSLSTPTDSGSFCSADNVCCAEPPREGGESYALLYPSGSSEGSASTDNVSVTAGDFLPDGRPRTRSRSISLKKPKKKPPPPVRSVSLMKNLGGSSPQAEGHFRDGRPKSLFLPGDHLEDSFQPDFLVASKPLQEEQDLALPGEPTAEDTQAPDRESELSFPGHWQLNEWKTSDPYRSLSSSSTATGTTVIECMKVRGSTESLNSPSTSRATSPSQLSVEAESKISPFKPLGLMSPSSGYSSQSETPTPTLPTSLITGPSSLGCRMRPKIPERKSSLPATSPGEKAARSRLSFELPVTSHLDLSAIKPKPKASRRHSDSSTSGKQGQKLSPSQSVMPMVTQTDLRNIRLRSVSRSEADDSPDGSSDIIEEEQGRDLSPPVSPDPKPKPPVAMKPPLPKRPLNLMLKCPSSYNSSSPLAPESPPPSPVDRPMPVGNIYKVMRKPKPKKLPQSPVSPGVAQEVLKQPLQQQPVPEEQPLTDHAELPTPSSPEMQDKSKTLPSRITISCLAELDKKRPKVPPPVPKKPSVLLLPTNTVHANGTVDRQVIQFDSGSQSPCGAPSSEELPANEEVHNEEAHNELHSVTTDEVGPKDSEQELDVKLDVKFPTAEALTENSLEIIEESSSVSEKNALHITEEAEDDVIAPTSTPHTTEDLFTIIHRSKRKVLGRKEPVDSFGSRQSLVSPVKSSGDVRALTLGSSHRSSSRNENFMALLQKKGGKASTGTRVSAMELLRSTNPLARRVTEFSQPDPDTAGGPKPPQDH